MRATHDAQCMPSTLKRDWAGAAVAELIASALHPWTMEAGEALQHVGHGREDHEQDEKREHAECAPAGIERRDVVERRHVARSGDEEHDESPREQSRPDEQAQKEEREEC